MKNPVDLHIGQRLRNRRWLMNWTQQDLASAVGIRFQQIQKYEKGDNRICSSRLWDLSRALDVPVSYFFEGLEPGAQERSADLLDQKESQQLLRAYYGMDERPRRTFLELAKTIAGDATVHADGQSEIAARTAA